MDRSSKSLFQDEDERADSVGNKLDIRENHTGYGILPSQRIKQLIDNKVIDSLDKIKPEQVQPASLDLRLGKIAHRIRASFLPGKKQSLRSQLPDLLLHTFDLSDGAVLEKNCVYLVELKESLRLPRGIAAVANPKSSTGRLDVFTRLICEFGEAFDSVEPGYKGPLFAEISPRSFSIKVREGSRLNQIRFRHHAPAQKDQNSFVLDDAELKRLHEASPLVDGDAVIRQGLHLRMNLSGFSGSKLIGYRAQQHTGVVDVDQVGRYPANEFWEPIHARANGRLILDPREFYILASKETLHIPPSYAAEMVPIDPSMGEYRVHYAGFFDPGFGHRTAGVDGSRAVLEVRSHEVPFFLEDEQLVGRLRFERLAEPPENVYGSGISSNYQGQGLKLSKHFVVPKVSHSRSGVEIQVSLTTIPRSKAVRPVDKIKKPQKALRARKSAAVTKPK